MTPFTSMDALVEPFALLGHSTASHEYLQQAQPTQHGHLPWPSTESSTASLLNTPLQVTEAANGLRVSSHQQITADEVMESPAKARKPKAPTLKDVDWAPYKDLIIDLHIMREQPLEWVRTYMESEYGFKAAYEPLRTLRKLHVAC